MRSIHEVINSPGPVDQDEALALALAACEGIVDPITHDYFVSELKSALVLIEVEDIMGVDGVVRNHARELLKKIEAATVGG
ncbi:hypothetical protein L598_000700000530 [Mesorhizobium sp. J18]|uniref:hypothetical protein n=1 Tax=Mesorhizobium sp. J18 TaxID=935263 RepID=UPI00119AB04E|nr:hypothetical protein [Mesorhizobium sp. J18]TWG90297.1 hypothetical protein L598_000700000530 [Mesorhizobium sp. J18]